MTPYRDDRSVSNLLSDAFQQLSTLVRSEIRLAQAELTAKATGAAIGIGLIFGAVLVVMATLVILLMMVAALLMQAGLSDALSFFLAAVFGLIVSAILAGVGLGRLRASTLTPQRTFGQLQRDASAAKGQLS